MPQQNNVKKGSFLDQLTKGLYDAMCQAVALAENQHIESIKKFFASINISSASILTIRSCSH